MVLKDDFAHADCASQSCGEDATECAPNPENWWHNGRLRMWIEARYHRFNLQRIFGFENHGTPFAALDDGP